MTTKIPVKKVQAQKEIVEKKKIEIKSSVLTTEVQKRKKKMMRVLLTIAISLLIAALNYLITKNILYSIIIFTALLVAFNLYLFYREKYEISKRIKKIEEVFPDFIELMSSNLRAGMTIDKSLLVSSRKEFAPLDEEILRLGKDIVTGKEITLALYEMGERINSEKIRKTITLIITGIVSGGNLSVLLEETAINMRERNFIEKRASSNVLMYIIFVFFAVAVGAPILFGLSTVLVKTITQILSGVPALDSATSARIPFAITKITITSTFINYFSLIYLIITSILSSLVIGVVNKGDEKSGINNMFPLAIISTSIYFLVQVIILKFILSAIG